jgi:hypothetical protein
MKQELFNIFPTAFLELHRLKMPYIDHKNRHYNFNIILTFSMGD